MKLASKVAVVGAGWAGCAAAVEATRLGHHVTVFEASRTTGGRARRVDVSHEGKPLALDNGQHILIGAYEETLKLMAQVGVDAETQMHRMPLTLLRPDGSGIVLPDWPAPLDALAGIIRARGWTWRDKLSLLRAAAVWKLTHFKCPAQQSVADVCRKVSPRIMAELIEPLCISALNTPVNYASGQVFLRVLHDSMFTLKGGSNLLLPMIDLSALLPEASLQWLVKHGGRIHVGTRVDAITPIGEGWSVSKSGSPDHSVFDQVMLACPPAEAARLALATGLPCGDWATAARGLTYEAITTVYVMAPNTRLRLPMLALKADADRPAQFVFDRGQLGGPAGLLAFVVSASTGSAAQLAVQVCAQAKDQCGIEAVQVLQTITEKRATFACAPDLKRPGPAVLPGLLACGDYVAGPYPATLEGAVRSGLYAARQLQVS